MTKTVSNIGQTASHKIPGRVHEHLARIRGEDGKISSLKEAKEMLAYLPHATVVYTDDPNAVPMAYMEANNFIKEYEKNLKDKNKSQPSGTFQKAANIYNNINKGIKTVKSVLSFAERIRKGIPIYG